jgi:hypothetical protein
MPNYQALTRKAALEAGVNPQVFMRLVRAESGFRPNAVSPAGAQGLTQLMPGTARGLEEKYGLDTATPYGNLLAGAYYLREQVARFGNVKLALAAYNAGPGAVEQYGGVPPGETQRYVSKILGSSKGGGLVSAPPNAATAFPEPVPSSSNLTGAIMGNLAEIAQTGKVDPVAMLGNISQGISMDRASAPISTVPVGTQAVPSRARSLAAMTGKVTVSPNANRAGVSLDPAVVDFVGQVSGIDGMPLTIGTGTNHNQFVVGTRRQSAHWTGEAADIPATGADLTRLGQAALVAAGMSPAEARKQTGGVYNIGGWQVIFNSNVGGNHYNHLHVGKRG